jgi:hypothetical protein
MLWKPVRKWKSEQRKGIYELSKICVHAVVHAKDMLREQERSGYKAG